MFMDALDSSILRLLSENARKSYRELSRELKVSLSTISNRVKILEKEGIIEGYIPLINSEKIGYDLAVIINIKIAHGKLIEVQQKISRNDHVKAVYDITGEWDSLVVAYFKNRRELNLFIKRLLSMNHVERSNTQIVLNIVKNEKRFH
jgi:DNA-binding Lrp family transcriptional regulator